MMYLQWHYMRVCHPFSELTIVSAIFCAIITPQVPAAVIDLFENSPQFVEKTTLGSNNIQSTAVLDGNLFPSRRIILQYGSQQATVSEGILNYGVSAHPNATQQSNDRGYLNLEYSSEQPVDLLGRGDIAFVVKFDSFHADYPYLVSFYVSNSFTLNPRSYPMQITQSGEFIVPFSRFGSVDLTAVKYLGVTAIRMPVGTSFTISSITTIPEPSGAALLLLAAMGLSVRKRGSGLIGKVSLS